MKQLFIAILFLGTVHLFAQAPSTSELKYKREVGIDASSLTRFIPFISLNEDFSPYLLSYRIHKDDKRFVRMDAGLNFGVNLATSDDSGNDGYFVGANARVGWGKKRTIARKTTLMTGVDLVGETQFRRNQQEQENGESTIKNTNTISLYSLGVGPFIGLQYDITDQLGIYTEASLYAIGGLNRSKSVSERPNTTTEATRYLFRLNREINLPGKIFVFYKF